jgi:CBS-domain-containing membrane protein
MMCSHRMAMIWQPMVAVIFIAVVLYALSQTGGSDIIWAIGAGALSSSACIVFLTPNSQIGHARHVIGGYAIGSLVGVLVHWIMQQVEPVLSQHIAQHHLHAFWVLAAISVGIAMVIMAWIKCLHPPAVGMSVVLVLDIHHYDTVIVILAAAVCLAIIRRLLNRYLQCLVEL